MKSQITTVKVIIMIFILALLLTAFAHARCYMDGKWIYDGGTRAIGFIEGNRIYSRDGSIVGSFEGGKVYNRSGSIKCFQDGNYTYARSGKILGEGWAPVLCMCSGYLY